MVNWIQFAKDMYEEGYRRANADVIGAPYSLPVVFDAQMNAKFAVFLSSYLEFKCLTSESQEPSAD